MKSSVPRMEPWGTPEVIEVAEYETFRNGNRKPILFASYNVNQDKGLFFILTSSLSCDIRIYLTAKADWKVLNQPESTI